MDRHDYHTFQILEHVEKSRRVTNRRMASKLDVSVKLAHSLLGQLVKKGLLHIRKYNSRRWDYSLTPKGIAEKARLTYQFLDFTMQFYREARRRSAEVLAGLHKQGVKRIAFLGVSEMAEIAFLGVQEHELELVEVFDDSRAGENFLGLNVSPIEGMKKKSDIEKILVTAYDPALPMGERYLPPSVLSSGGGYLSDVAGDERLVWVFGEQLPTEAGAGTEDDKERARESGPREQ